MVAAMMLAVSFVALTQFAVYYWRAVLAHVAAQPVSDRVWEAAGLGESSLGVASFETLLALHEVTATLDNRHGRLWGVRAYCSLIGTLRRLGRLAFPGLAAWSERELATCSRYVAVMVNRRIERTLACAAQVRSF